MQYLIEIVKLCVILFTNQFSSHVTKSIVNLIELRQVFKTCHLKNYKIQNFNKYLTKYKNGLVNQSCWNIRHHDHYVITLNSNCLRKKKFNKQKNLRTRIHDKMPHLKFAKNIKIRQYSN